MTDEHTKALKNFRKQHDLFVGIDSDGCVFDTMEIKQKECFIPNIIYHWGLQGVSRFARETEEWINLYSKWRGTNRFPALVKLFDLLAKRPEAVERGYTPPQIDSLREWTDRESRLGNATLKAEVERTNDPVLAKTLAWSNEVNAAVAKMVKGIPPFPHVRQSLEKLSAVADVVVVSATPCEALLREWQEHDLDGYAQVICGQEMGTKKEHLQQTAGDRYDDGRVLMVGDAPGDMRAAGSCNALFYPIIPGREPQSWQRFYEEAIDKFLAGRYDGRYEKELADEFLAHLPAEPPWETI